MKPLDSTALRYDGKVLWVLDQRALPLKEAWISCESIEHMVLLIQQLSVRGAPLIGVAAALALGQFAESGASAALLRVAAIKLRNSRPTAVNLMYAIDRLLGNMADIPKTAEKIFEEDVELCKQIANHGAALIESGDSLLTHCNAGSLATAGVGTALGIIHKAFIQGKKIHVYVDETRPLWQGARLTTWELAKWGIPHTLICDNMAASLMREGKIEKVFVGADRISLSGDFANKIGTYSVAVNCHFHKIPFYVAAPSTTIDFECLNGASIPIEMRAKTEVLGYGSEMWSSPKTDAHNPAFDITPGSLVTKFILDRGMFSPTELTKARS